MTLSSWFYSFSPPPHPQLIGFAQCFVSFRPTAQPPPSSMPQARLFLGTREIPGSPSLDLFGFCQHAAAGLRALPLGPLQLIRRQQLLRTVP